jgi:hypothetical protein
LIYLPGKSEFSSLPQSSQITIPRSPKQRDKRRKEGPGSCLPSITQQDIFREERQTFSESSAALLVGEVGLHLITMLHTAAFATFLPWQEFHTTSLSIILLYTVGFVPTNS